MGNRREPRSRPANQVKPSPPPSPPQRVSADENKQYFPRTSPPTTRGRDRRIPVRSKASGVEGYAYVDDPHIWVEGRGIAGWYRLESIGKDFIAEGEDGSK